MRPPPLAPGARIRIIAPASAPLDLDRIHAGVRTLRSLGFVVDDPREINAFGYLAGTDAERLAELNDALSAPDVDALICVRGGYGVLRLLDGINFDAARTHPKLLIGYSDITALQLSLFHRAGWASISGPMVAVEWHEPDPLWMDPFLAMARGACPSPFEQANGEPLHVHKAGKVEGTLLGGNLTLVSRLLGSSYSPNYEGAILFLEDVGEAIYAVDSLLAHLHLNGVLRALGGLVFGQFTDAPPLGARPTLTLHDVFAHYATFVNGPVLSNLNYGHFPIKSPLPIGVRARLEAKDTNGALHILEPVTRPTL